MHLNIELNIQSIFYYYIFFIFIMIFNSMNHIKRKNNIHLCEKIL
jgi:hypothetical protein